MQCQLYDSRAGPEMADLMEGTHYIVIICKKSSVMCRYHIIYDINSMMAYMVNLISCTCAIISDEI
jgi:hypothetical protein